MGLSPHRPRRDAEGHKEGEAFSLPFLFMVGGPARAVKGPSRAPLRSGSRSAFGCPLTALPVVRHVRVRTPRL